jgi:hypothetical protein
VTAQQKKSTYSFSRDVEDEVRTNVQSQIRVTATLSNEEPFVWDENKASFVKEF